MNAEHEMNLSKTLSIFFVFFKFERFVTIQNIKSSTIENIIVNLMLQYVPGFDIYSYIFGSTGKNDWLISN